MNLKLPINQPLPHFLPRSTGHDNLKKRAAGPAAARPYPRAGRDALRRVRDFSESGLDWQRVRVRGPLHWSERPSRERSGFTLIELLVVIAIMALVASMLVGLSGVAVRKSKESRVRTELNQLVSALENYKSRYGFYPPDNSIQLGTNISANPTTNQLFYELTGTTSQGAGENRGFLSGPGVVRETAIKKYFNRDGFVNATQSPPDPDGPKNAKNFLPTLKASQVKKISEADNIEVLAVPVDWPGNDPVPPFKAFVGDNVVRRINPWRYVSSAPTNNPAGFDLWAEFVLGGKRIRISNWEREPVIVKP